MQRLLFAGAFSLARETHIKVPVLTRYHIKTSSPPRLRTDPAVKFIAPRGALVQFTRVPWSGPDIKALPAAPWFIGSAHEWLLYPQLLRDAQGLLCACWLAWGHGGASRIVKALEERLDTALEVTSFGPRLGAGPALKPGCARVCGWQLFTCSSCCWQAASGVSGRLGIVVGLLVLLGVVCGSG